MPEDKKIRFTPELLAKYGLPDIEYPVPARGYKQFISENGFQPGKVLYWLQDYPAQSPTDWLVCEPAMLRISELLAPCDIDPGDVHIEGDNWSLLISSVDLNKEIVTIQRNNCLLAAIQNDGNGRLVAAAYRPLDAKSIGFLTNLAVNPAYDGTVCMRPNNWEYALDSSGGMGNIYAAERGEPYLSYWEFGLGLNRDGSTVPEWHAQRRNKPVAATYSAIQIGTWYESSASPAAERRKCSYTYNWIQFMQETKWVRDIFSEVPGQWGLRGDPYLWQALEKSFYSLKAPKSSNEFENLLESAFERLVGVPITHDKDVFVPEFAHGGMSSGYVCLIFWRETAFPMLCRRLEITLIGKMGERINS